MELSRQDRHALERLEEELWREKIRFDFNRMNEIIAPDFFEFGRSGRVYQRVDTTCCPKDSEQFRKRILRPLLRRNLTAIVQRG